MKIMITFGTRPEAIKMMPIIKKLEQEKNIETVILTTGQHKDMLDTVLEKFEIRPKYKLDIMKQNQSLSYINASILETTNNIFEIEKPDLLLVHGDTTTSFACAQSAFYNKIMIGHVEAGLRTFNKYFPFPEEINRSLISKIADIHFAPTNINKENLINEGINEKYIYVTGNTIIDALKYTISDNYEFESKDLKKFNFKEKKYILVTAHRRENFGKPLEEICNAICEIALQKPDVEIIYPVHLNPNVRNTVYEKLHGIKNIHLIEPTNVFDMHNLIKNTAFVLTDSGSLQEEAPACRETCFGT